MAGETTITVIGNLTDDPELRFTPSGAAVAKFRIASTPRTLDRTSGEWKDGEPLFLACSVWRQVAENVAESLQRGARVIVSGRLRQRSYETREGEKRTVAPSLDTYLNVIRTSGGSVEKLDVWGRRRLSFEINKKAEGIYAVIDLQAEPAAVAELDRQLRLNESVLRTKVIRPDVR
jgi:single stranded DNA-binding protein